MKYWFIFIISALLSTVSFAFEFDEPKFQAIKQAQFKTQETQPLQTVALPHSWKNKDQTVGVYQLTFGQLSNDEVYALLIPKLVMASYIRLNGIELLSPDQTKAYLSQQWNTPLRLYLPQSALLETNKLEVETLSYTGSGLLAPVYIGLKDDVEVIYQKQLFWQQTIHKYLFVVSLCTAVFSLLLWLNQRQRTDFLFFAAAAAFWCCYSLSLFIINPPVSNKLWWWWVHSSFDFWAISMVLFSYRILGQSYPRGEQALISFGIGASAVYFASNVNNLANVTSGLHFISLGLLVIIVLHHLPQCSKPRSIESRLLVFSCLILVAFNAHDLYFISPFTTDLSLLTTRYSWLSVVSLAPFGQAFFVVIMLWLQVKQFTLLASDIEDLQKNLESNIRETTQSYHQEQLKIQALHLTTAANKERQQVYQSLYEDLADKLSAIYHTAKDEKQADAAKAAIAELRDTAETHQYDKRQLDIELANIRAEMDHRCAQAQLSLHWESLIDIPALAISNSLSLTLKRILREGLSNIIKHADATQVLMTINMASNQSVLLIRLTDNGAGLVANTKEGRGMANIRKRATDLGGDVKFSNHDSGGLMLELSLPCQS